MKSNVKVLICDPIHEDGIKKMVQAGFTVNIRPDISEEELKAIVSKYDVLIVRSRTKVSKEIIDKGNRLKAIGRAGAGLDNIDLEAAKKRKISVFHSPESPAEGVAELTVGLIISLARNIPLANNTMKRGKWTKSQMKGWELKGKTLGVLGLGNIGKRVAKICKALGMKILITKRTSPDPKLLTELEGEFVPLRELLERSDVVTIHIPLNSKTQHMIGKDEIQLMKDGAYLINTSRGPIVDEKALLKGLQSRKLGGAGLDVYDVEPPKHLNLVKLSNVICTPHIGSQTVESQRKAAIIIIDKIRAYLQNS